MIRRLTIALLAVAVVAGVPLPAADSAEDIRAERREVAELLQRAYVFVASGSGVLISADGYILSNHHVTVGSWEHRVRLASGDAYHATVVGTDPFGDLSLLKIEEPPAEGLPFVRLGESADIAVGRPVLAIGNPFGLGDTDDLPTVTLGRLGSGRIVRGVYTDAIQVDAAVNPGNSGGPSLGMDGRLLGINGQIRTRTGMRINSGIGLAIACTQIRAFLPLLKDTPSRYVHHTAMPDGLELEHTGGAVLVVAWDPDDEAHAELLRPGERLVAIAERPVVSLATAEGLFASLPWTGPDTTVPITVQSTAGENRRIDLPAGRTAIPGKAWHGLAIETRTVRTDDGEREKHLVVTGVDSGSPAEDAGIVAGARVLEANGRTLERRLDLLKALVPLEIGDRLDLRLRDAESGEERSAGFYLMAKP